MFWVAEAKCENVWMEVCTKVAAAALVSVPGFEPFSQGQDSNSLAKLQAFRTFEILSCDFFIC